MSETRTPALDVGGSTDRFPTYVNLVYALVLVWGLGDVISTLLAAATAGAALEANPWIRVLLEAEPLLFSVLKAAVVLYAGVVLLVCRPVVERVPGWRLWFVSVVAAGIFVTAGNLAVGFVATV
ncbi:MAG: DUF5658 family protein [Salinirussus sp.]